jgi:quercetin dioxygenase-like cupin family protein
MKALLIAVAFPMAAFGAAPAKQVQVLPDGLTWTDLAPGVSKYAPINGDPKKGPFTFVLKMTAGNESGWHTHDADYTAVVVTGTVENVEQGGEADAKPMPVGSWWMQPAKRNHNTKCAAGADCTLIATVKGGFTMHPKTADGKDAPPPPKDAKAGDAKAGDAKKEPAKPAEPAKK